MSSKVKALILIGILLLAAFLRLYRYDLADVINDEVFYGYRSIGLIDSLNSPLQPTPYESFTTVPLWAKLSFHDHPPLAFWIQHLSFKIFGTGLLGLRLPFILAGVASVLLVYLIARILLREEKAALLSAAILAVNNYHVFISRIGLQEGLVILFMLLAVLLFLKMINTPAELDISKYRYFELTAAATGLAILTKYTAVILLPIFLAYLLWKRRKLLTWKRIWVSAGILFVILSPVIIYNIWLYKTAGHFDFQISYLLRQNVPEWQIRPGREVGGVPDRMVKLFTQFGKGYGPVFSAVTLAAFVFALRKRREEATLFLSFIFAFLFLLFLAIGPQERFLAMLSPFVAILIAAGAYRNIDISKYRVAAAGLALFLLLELAYTVNTYLLISPKGKPAWTYSILRYDHNAWGYNQLDAYLENETKGFYPAATLPLRFLFAQKLQSRALAAARAEGRKPRAILFVTDSRLQGMASLWYLTRRAVYEGWPIISDQAYLDATSQDLHFFEKSGVKEIIFIKAEDTLLRPDEPDEPERRFVPTGIKPLEIRSLQGKTAFRVYKLREL